MSIIPKINVGLSGRKREKINLSFDNSTTSNVGNIQPTMCRELVPNSKLTVKVSSLVRLASMPLPTFGRMSLRHYHCFVPYVDLYQPFDALMSGQHYADGNNTFVPTTLPWFTMMNGLKWFFYNLCDISIAPVNDLDHPYSMGMTNVSNIDGTVFDYGEGTDYPEYIDAVKAAQAHDLSIIATAWDVVRVPPRIFGQSAGSGYLFGWRRMSSTSPNIDQSLIGSVRLGAFSIVASGSVAGSALKIAYPENTDANVLADTSGTVITADGADIITKVGDYYLLMKFRPALKRLRTIFIGLGYQFSPYNNEELSYLKILAYYKAWFNIFSPIRERAFVDTPCYRIIKRISSMNGSSVVATLTEDPFGSDWGKFMYELATECYYYLPMDYFSMSVVRPQQANSDVDFEMYSGALSRTPSTTSAVNDRVISHPTGMEGTTAVPVVNYAAGNRSPLTLKLAFQMLKWANKNTVIGRSVRDYLKVHFGVEDVNDIDDAGVYRVGSSRVNVSISDVMSTAENEQGYLGEYGGKGIGFGDSETFDFTTDKFGVFITLSVIVPESGYYQGYLKENRHLTRYQFFNPEFDALGYQVLERGEIMDDYNCDSATWNPADANSYERTKAFGFVPRYSEYKVGRNIVNGDLSLVGLKDSMSPYTLDRRIAAANLVTKQLSNSGSVSRTIEAPNFVPSIVYDAFRRIDPTDHLGQYNRIFNYGGNDLDHFIIHNIFDVNLYAPMKSLASSFDAVDEGEQSIDVTHS